MPEDLIKYNQLKSHHWITVSKNPNVSIEYILLNWAFSWDESKVALNPNLTVDLMINNKDTLWYDIDCNIAYNHMTYTHIIYKKHIKNYVIKSHIIIQNLTSIITEYV